MSSPAVASRPGSARRLAVLLVTTLVLTLTALVAPQTKADAQVRPRITTRTTTTYAHAMLYRLNLERRAHGRRPLRMNSKLILSAHRHNLHMAAANTMSHQLPREAFFAVRIRRAGYNWLTAGENIGWTSYLGKAGILQLQRQMYLEKPPNDGHRQNILSRAFRDVGIDVYYDARHHKLWFTQDFGRLA